MLSACKQTQRAIPAPTASTSSVEGVAEEATPPASAPSRYLPMRGLAERLMAPDGPPVSGTGSSEPIPIRKAGTAFVAGFRYVWFHPEPYEAGVRVHLGSPERLYVLHAMTGKLVSEERLLEGSNDLGLNSGSRRPVDTEAMYEAMDRLLWRLPRAGLAPARLSATRSSIE